MSLINCEMELDLKWTKNFLIFEILRTAAVTGNANANPTVPALATIATNSTMFQINNAKFYAPVFILSINVNINFLENIKKGFKRTIYWNKYRSKITTQPKNNNLDYLIDSTFRNFNRLFVLSFKKGDNDPTRSSIDKYYMSLIEIKYFNALIDNISFFHQPVKINKEFMKNLSKRKGMMTIQQESYYICHIIKIIINSFI